VMSGDGMSSLLAGAVEIIEAGASTTAEAVAGLPVWIVAPTAAGLGLTVAYAHVTTERYPFYQTIQMSFVGIDEEDGTDDDEGDDEGGES